jgi:hypothetical protein
MLRTQPGLMSDGSAPMTARFASYHRGQAAAIWASEASGPSRRAARSQRESPRTTVTVDGSPRGCGDVGPSGGPSGGAGTDAGGSAEDGAERGTEGTGSAEAPEVEVALLVGQTGAAAEFDGVATEVGTEVGTEVAAEVAAEVLGVVLALAVAGASTTVNPTVPATARVRICGTIQPAIARPSAPVRPGTAAATDAAAPTANHAATHQRVAPARVPTARSAPT